LEPPSAERCTPGMTRATLCLTMALSLILATEAMAKEIVAAKVCGASDCREVRDERSLLALHEGGPPTDPPEKASPFYRAELTVKGDGNDRFTFRLVLVPGAGMIRGANDDGSFAWMPVSDTAVGQFRRMTRGLAPIAAKKLDGLGPAKLPEARVDEVVVIPQDSSTGASAEAPVWPWIAGGLAAVIILGLALTWRGKGAPGAGAVRSRP
jgi:hypothetical protein